MMIPFNIPLQVGKEVEYIQSVMKKGEFAGDGEFTKKCQKTLEKLTGSKKIFLTPSGTQALEMTALLLDLHEDDEVIMSSYTFVSTANAFILRGAKIVFVDIDPITMNIDLDQVERHITPKTKAIVPVHYAGVGCPMDNLLKLACEAEVYVIEDAAQALMAQYNGKSLGTFGSFGCYSFHDTKNFHCGEGGALLVNEEAFVERAEIIREKGTNRSKFMRGEIDKYTWVELGSSYLLSELNAAFLFAQLEQIRPVTEHRLRLWNQYMEELRTLPLIDVPQIPDKCSHNAHIFYIKVANGEERQELIRFLRENGIQTAFHYVPLHNSPFAVKFTSPVSLPVTEKESQRLLRLPLYYNLSSKEISYICDKIKEFYRVKS